MRTVKIKFVDFFEGFDYKNSRIFQILDKHYNIEFTDDPEYIIYSVFGNEHLEYDCVRIFWTGENIVPDFNLCDYAIGFEHMTLGDRYLRCPNYIVTSSYQVLLDQIQSGKRMGEENRDFCSFCYSNRRADKIRDKLFYWLSQYRKVDSGGKHLNNIKISGGGGELGRRKIKLREKI